MPKPDPTPRSRWRKPSRWRRELARASSDPVALGHRIGLGSPEREALDRVGPLRPVAVPSACWTRLRNELPDGPLRRQLLPQLAELETGPGESGDPLDELHHQPVPGLIHRYPDRALLLTTGRCFGYCRFCTRARLAAKPAPRLDDALEYLRLHDEIREVILSGGDPLVLPDAELELLLRELRTIPHVELLRLGTRAPVFLPRRITTALVKILQRAQPLFVMVHVNHPSEVDPGFVRAVGRLVDAGLPVLSQTVLLRGVNAEVDTLAKLFRALLRARVTPYYLHHCDLALGTGHLRVGLDEGIALIGALRDRMSGLAVPTYVVDLPEAGGKVELAPERLISRQPEGVLLRAVDGREILVPEPPSAG